MPGTAPDSGLQVTGESSWERPAEFKGDVEKASSNPVPISTGVCEAMVVGAQWGPVLQG
ncbi:MAG TPA: hypothetical protein ACFYEA_10500 [Candidatus Tripitaka californicus]|uniref:hypothetical protein n=1 Tax=Candidatus Tripitaka californicus TaxID=3367616 RepID=UPI0040251668